MTAEEIKILSSLILKQRKVRASHLEFMKHCWMKNNDDPFIIGFHTRKICARIDKAFQDLREGKSTFLIINTHHRTGKSDMVSRYLGAHFLGEFPNKEVMQVSYQANLSTGFSGFGRNIVRTVKYQELYPEIYLSRESNKKNDWVITNDWGAPTGGRLYASGLRSGLTGNGYHLGIVDDWFASRKEAESQVMRNNVWDAFTNDFMTRRAPVSITIIIGTSWHEDGLINRLRKHQKENPNFPKFEELIFPARARDYKGEGEYNGEFLFTDRYDLAWYREQYATLGRYAAAALMDCDPQKREGAILNIDNVVFHDIDDPQAPKIREIKWAQVWDLAHTAKQRTGDDPDYTSGTLLAFKRVPGDPVPHLWIRNWVQFRENAVERDNKIKFETTKHGGYVIHAVETSLDNKDAYHYLNQAMPEYSWKEIKCHGMDKVVRCVPLEPIFDAPGHVHLIRGNWNEEWLQTVSNFTGSGKEHDDAVDNLSAGYILLMGGKIEINQESRENFARRKRAL